MTEQQPPPEENSEKVKPSEINGVENLKNELEKEIEKSNNYLNRLKYLQADFENYKKRVKKEMDETIRYGNRRLVLELLIIIDELECAVEAGKHNAGKSLLEGVEMTLKKLYNILEYEGLLVIETVGKPFDPHKHEAVLRVEMKEKDGIILEEVRKGFMLKDMVIRPSLVKVAVDTSKEVKENE